MAKGQIKQAQRKIDKKIFENLCMIHCTKDEIASVFECSIDTIAKFCNNEYKTDFTTVLKKFSANGKVGLRRAQFKIAQTNPTMAIWLGKQYLGQTDKIETEIQDKIIIVNDIPENDEEE